MTAGDIYTVAGGGTGGLGDGGPATSAKVSPNGVALDTAGNLVIADGQGRVRVVAVKAGTFYGQPMTAGDIYTVAGNGTTSYSGDGGPATQAQLNNPAWVAADAAGNLVIADLNNFRVRVAAAVTGTFYGRAMTAGDIYTVAGHGKPDLGAPGFLASGLPATRALITPEAVALDAAGNLVISEGRGLRVVAATTGTFYGQAMTAGDIYTIAGNGKIGFSGDGGPAAAAEFFDPRGVVADAAGNLVIADTENDRLRVLAASTGTFYGLPMTAGDIYTVAGAGHGGLGDGGPAITAELSQPGGVALDAAGNVVIADSSDRRIRVIAVTTGTFYGQAMTADDIYTVAGGGTGGLPVTVARQPAAELNGPRAVAVDPGMATWSSATRRTGGSGPWRDNRLRRAGPVNVSLVLLSCRRWLNLRVVSEDQPPCGLPCRAFVVYWRALSRAQPERGTSRSAAPSVTPVCVVYDSTGRAHRFGGAWKVAPAAIPVRLTV